MAVPKMSPALDATYITDFLSKKISAVSPRIDLPKRDGDALKPRMLHFGLGQDSEYAESEFAKSLKYSYLIELCNKQNITLLSLVETVLKMETEIQDETTKIQTVISVVLNGCFLIQLIIKFNEGADYHQFLWPLIARDLLLIKNQMPFSFIYALVKNVFDDDDHLINSFFKSLLDFFSNTNTILLGRRNFYNDRVHPSQVLHLVDFVHRHWVSNHRAVVPNATTRELPSLFGSATELHAHGITFKCAPHTYQFDIHFMEGIMFIPKLVLDKNTESLFINLLHFEQYYCPEHKVIPYVQFLGSLVIKPEDAKLLRDLGIIDNQLLGGAADENTIQLFKKLHASAIAVNPSPYSEIYDAVRLHCNKRWNHYRAFYVRHHSSTLCLLLYFLIVTFLRTVFTIWP